MVRLGHVEVSILVNAKHISEYEVKVSDDGKSATCWIASEAGKAFAMRYTDHNAICTTSAFLTLDGARVGGVTLHPARPGGNNRSSADYSSVAISSFERKPFIFSPVETTDDDDVFARTNLSLGEIVVSVHQTVPQMVADTFNPPTLSSLQVHERAKKAAVHGVKLGETINVMNAPRILVQRRAKLAEITFRYRPIDVLRADGIAPRMLQEAHHKHEVIDLTIEDDSEPEADPEAERITALEVELRRLKQQKLQQRTRDPTGTRVNRKIKEEKKVLEL